MSYAALVGAWKEIDGIPADSEADAVEYLETHVKSGQLGDIKVISIAEDTAVDEQDEVRES